MESIRKLSNFDFQWTKILYQNNNIANKEAEGRRSACKAASLRWPEPIDLCVDYVFDLHFFRVKDSTDFYDFWHP